MVANRALAPVAVLAAALALGLGACGGDDDSVSQEELQQATEEAAQEAREEAKDEAQLDDLRKEIEELKKDQDSDTSTDTGTDATTTTTTATTGGGGVPSDAENCGAGVYAQAGTTSCSFALNVASDYYSSPSNSFRSYSPATGQTYQMTCSGAAPVVCTGGNNAAVYIP